MKRFRPHLLVLCVLTAVTLTGMHTALQNWLVDMRFSRLSRDAGGQIAIVAIDSSSIDKIGVWPWPRKLHAELIGRLQAGGADEIAFDVDFSAPSDSINDQAFADALRKAGGSVILPSFKQIARRSGANDVIHVSRPLPQFSKYSWEALVNVPIEADGLMRRYQLGDRLGERFLPSLATLVAGPSELNDETFRIDYSIRLNTFPMVSYADVLRGNPDALRRLKNKKVIIGATAIELGDRFYVPNGRVVSGVELQALAAETILQGRMLRSLPDTVFFGILFLVALLMIVMWKRRSALLRATVLVGLAVVAEAIATMLQMKFALILDGGLLYVSIVAYLFVIAIDEIDIRNVLNWVAESRFRRIAMSLGEGLVCVDQSGFITFWNPAATAIFGYEPKEVVGQPISKLFAASGDAGKKGPFSIFQLRRELLQAPGGMLMEFEGRRKNGEVFSLETCWSEWQGADGFQYGAALRDISARKLEAERIRYLAERDTLTGLANRYTLNSRLHTELLEAKAEKREVALLLIDLDKFKQINDTLGHACGDELLRAVADRLVSLAEDIGLVARWSGDEFAIMVCGADVSAQAHALSARVCAAFDEIPLAVGNRKFRVGVSIGAALYPWDCETAEELLGNADLALYQAKIAGRGRYYFFEQQIRDELEAKLQIEAGLALGAERGEFELYYQPQVNLKDFSLVGVEALIRWRHPDRGLVLPTEFMSIANATSISDKIALWVMETACRQGRLWQCNGHAVRLAVNLAPSQLLSGDLVATLKAILKDSGFPPALLELEVTENILLADDDSALKTFHQIQDLGVKIAFDDFGTGYASLTYLKKCPLDRLKIDRSFVRGLLTKSDDAAIVRSTINLAKQMNLSVIAEGIENRVTADMLRRMACDEGQGYYFGEPMPAKEFAEKFLLGTPPEQDVISEIVRAPDVAEKAFLMQAAAK